MHFLIMDKHIESINVVLKFVDHFQQIHKRWVIV